jgi:hypothetical protein
MPATLRVFVALVALMTGPSARPAFSQAPAVPSQPPPSSPPPAPAQPPASPPPQPSSPQAPATPPAAEPPVITFQKPTTRVFASPAGMVFNLIKPDKTADFDLVLTRLRSALTNNPDPVRKKQGAGWKVYKASEPHQGSVLYIFLIDPAVPDADYSISKILAEMYPAEVQDLYVKFRDAYTTGQTMWNLTPVGETTAATRTAAK